MLRPTKKIWDMLRLTYGRVFEMYGQLFIIRQGDRLVQEHFTLLRALLDELEIYQPLIVDITQMKSWLWRFTFSI